MKINPILHHVNKNKSLQMLKDFINKFYGLELTLLDSTGQIVSPAAAIPKPEEAVAILQSSDRFGSEFNEDAVLFHTLPIVKADCLTEIRESKKASITECPRYGFKQVLVPVIPKEDVVGIIFVSENNDVRLTQTQCETIKDFLSDFIKRLTQTETEFLRHFENQGMTQQEQAIKRVIEYIHINYNKSSLTLRDVSVQNGISYHYLSSLFKKIVNTSFKNYVNSIRLDRAVKLLKNKSLSVNQIAYDCGFEDPAYFSKAFKIHLGTSPSTYRIKHTTVKQKLKTSFFPYTLPRRAATILKTAAS